jgi:two-component system LytT family sensor kinase
MKKSVEIIVNIVFWVIIASLLCWLFYAIFLTAMDGFYDSYYHFELKDILKYLSFLLLTLPGLLLNYYFFYLYLIPFLRKKKYALMAMLALGGSFISAFLVFLGLCIAINPQSVWPSIIFLTLITVIVGISGGAIKGFILWRNSIAERIAIEKKHLESKTALLLLKAQLNPHFLFNSLNNIDILIEENPKTASEYLKKLSDILRYILYETKEDVTNLTKEIAQIKNYIELQKIRTDNTRYVNFNINGELNEQKIAPMIFLPFIENAFKHSKNKTIDNAIDIYFEVSNSSVIMVCKNYYDANQLDVIKNEGLGTETIKQRLNLLFPELHELIIDKTEHWFNVTLSIKLKDGN